LSGRPPTPPCVPVWYTAVQWFHAVSASPVPWFQSLIFGALEVSLSSTLLSPFGCFRITAITHQWTFFSLPWHPLFSPSRSARTPIVSGTSRFTVLWPLLTSGRSAIHYCMGCSGCFTLCVSSRPPQVRAGNLHSI
jgi:hypothetical protein